MPRQKKSEQPVDQSPEKQAKKDFVFAVGRRKEAVARVRLYPDGKAVAWGSLEGKKGDFFVNQKRVEEYFGGVVAKAIYEEPLRITNVLGKFTVTVKVAGGGKSSQLDAVVHGVARALSAFDSEKFRSILKKKGLLTRDSRARERRKPGMGGKSRRKRQSPKR